VVVFLFVGPCVLGVQDFLVDSRQGFGILKMENWKSFEFSIVERSVMNGVDDSSSVADTDSLNRQ